jgi:serine/threonine-protein kinase
MPNDAHAARQDDRLRAPVAAQGVILGGKYRLEEAIARGGMARVWRARHIELNRPVAVKFVDGAGAGANGIERFLVEAKVAASIRHKNVVDILDFGFVEEPGREPEPYMVMELLEGETLGDRIERGRLEDDESVDIVLQLLSGLDAVHRAGIIHRDLKPGNLFLTHDHDGTFARLLDFGISEGAEPHATMEAGQVVGTPEYMSPEQAFGAAVDLRADLYGVGVMFYEMLSGGRLPFEHDEAHRVLEMVAAGAHRPLVELRPQQPELAAVVERALSRNPEDRYANAREMRRAIIDATGTGDTTTERMAAIRESGTRRRPQLSTAAELVAAPLPPGSIPPGSRASTPPSARSMGARSSAPGTLPAGSPLLVVPMPTSEAPRSRAAPIAIGVAIALAAAAGAGWALTSREAPVVPTPDAVIDGAAPESEAENEAAENEAAANEAANEAAADDAANEATADDAASALADLATDREAPAPIEPLAPDEALDLDEAVELDEAVAARRPRRARPATSPDTTDSAPPSAPVDPPRAVVRDLDF